MRRILLLTVLLLVACDTTPTPVPVPTAQVDQPPPTVVSSPTTARTTVPPATPASVPSAVPTANGVVTISNPGDLLALVTKQRQLPQSYIPQDLVAVNPTIRTTAGTMSVRRDAFDPLKRMVEEMRRQGLDPAIVSAYRSYEEQRSTFTYWVNALGQAQAERVSAKAGHSEHQLGLAIDVGTASTGYTLEESFAGTAEGKWLAANAGKYGFIMSYPADKVGLTGYDFEPWHFRYVGLPAAQEISDRRIVLQEYVKPKD